MQTNILIAAIAATFAFGAAAQAQVALTAGELNLAYSAFTDETSVNKLTLGGSAELGFSPNFGVQGDLRLNQLGFIDDNATNAALHAVYHVDDTFAMGAFYGADQLDGDTQDFYGLEVAYDNELTAFEAYLGQGKSDGETGTLIGFSGSYALNDQFSLGGSVDSANIDGLDATRISLDADYRFTDNIAVNGEIGNVNADLGGGSGSEPYVGIGATVTFGAARGATFGQRSILNFLPGL